MQTARHTRRHFQVGVRGGNRGPWFRVLHPGRGTSERRPHTRRQDGRLKRRQGRHPPGRQHRAADHEPVVPLPAPERERLDDYLHERHSHLYGRDPGHRGAVHAKRPYLATADRRHGRPALRPPGRNVPGSLRHHRAIAERPTISLSILWSRRIADLNLGFE